MLAIGALTQMVPDRWFTGLEFWYDRTSLVFKVALPFLLIFLIAIAAPGGVPPFILPSDCLKFRLTRRSWSAKIVAGSKIVTGRMSPQVRRNRIAA